MIDNYYQLTKPGIIYGNLITATGGFLLASKGNIDFGLFLATLAGISLVIASAGVFNNYIDRDIDHKMARTKKRAIASGVISGRNALIYATILGLAGFILLGLFTNLTTVLVGLVAILVYVVVYGISKRRTVHGTVVGSIAGAAPVVAGYTAAIGRFDLVALILFLILVFWQMPHFYAIAIYRFDDYKSAGLPVLPIKKGIRITKIQMLVYIAAFIAAALTLSVQGYAGYIYAVVMALLGLAWLALGVKGLNTSNDKLWARKMFFLSLVVIMAFSVMLSLESVLY